MDRMVDHAFVIKFQGELVGEWTLADSAGNVHIVYYNQDILSPEILDGWSTLSSFMALKATTLYSSVTLVKVVSI